MDPVRVALVPAPRVRAVPAPRTAVRVARADPVPALRVRAVLVRARVRGHPAPVDPVPRPT